MMLRAIRQNAHRRGQIAVALLFAMVLGLIAYAVVINLGRLSQTKVQVTIASNIGAAQLASLVISYGQQIFHEQLGGEVKKGHAKDCKYSIKPLANLILAPFKAVVAFLIVLVTEPGNIVGATIVAAMAIASGITSTLNYMISEVPAYNAMWRAAQARLSTNEERFVADAARTALANAVGDTMTYPDWTDVNVNRKWGEDDYVGRFSLVMNEYYRSLSGGEYTIARRYLADLEEFLYSGRDGWGLADKPGDFCIKPGDNGYAGPDPYVNPETNGTPAMCDPCCVPATGEDGTGTVATRPPGCSDADAESCAGESGRSPYPDRPNVYEYVYDNPWNSYYSFRERMGIDDERPEYRKNLDDPNIIPQTLDPSGFRFTDVTRRHPEDIRWGGYELFWRMNEFGMDLNKQVGMSSLADVYGCLWCDPNIPNISWEDSDHDVDSEDPLVVGSLDGIKDNDHEVIHCAPCDDNVVDVYNGTIRLGQLNLPNDPSTMTYDKTYYIPGSVDNTVNTANGADNPPLGVDKVVPSPWMTELDDNGNPHWQAGEERFCHGDDWPHWWPCSVSDQQMSTIHWVVYGLEEFINWAFALLRNDEFSAANVIEWKDKIGGEVTAPDGGRSYEGYHGRLGNVRDKIRILRDKISNPDFATDIESEPGWLETSFASDDYKEAWCVPTEAAENSCGGLDECHWIPPSQEEHDTFDVNSNGIRGDPEDVAACLTYNVSEPENYGAMLALLGCLHHCDPGAESGCAALIGIPAGDFTEDNCAVWRKGHPYYDILADKLESLYESEEGKGNPARFAACQNDCPAECHDMPRPLVPDFDPNLDPGDSDDVAKCSDDDWLAKLEQSRIESINQVVKFKQRRDYLIPQVMLARYLYKVLDDAYKAIDSFIKYSTPVFNSEPKNVESLIYGWKDPKSQWSIVQASASVTPDTEIVDGKPKKSLPWLDTNTNIKPWNLLHPSLWKKTVEQCYTLRGTEGTVKVSVTRYDQPSSDPEKDVVKFANKKPFWKFFRARPDAQPPAGADLTNWDTTGLDSRCSQFTYQHYLGKKIEGAFMIGAGSTAAKDADCVTVVNNLLSQGVASSTCAEYHFNEKKGIYNQGMMFKFKKCGN